MGERIRYCGARLNTKEELSKGDTMRAVVGAIADVGLIMAKFSSTKP